MSRLPTEESFLKDVANHELTVLHEDGVYRHLRFRSPKSWAYGFDVTTWPGYLCYTGDMGCYVFRRLEDMLEFFRDSRSDARLPLRIDPWYWGQKAEAVCRSDGLKEYSPELFKGAVNRWLYEAFEDEEDGVPLSLREAVEREVLSAADDGEHEAIRAAMDFEHDGFRFEDFYEVNVKEYTSRFLWCCYALTWAVKKYDEHKAAEDQASACCHAPGALDEILSHEEIRKMVKKAKQKEVV